MVISHPLAFVTRVVVQVVRTVQKVECRFGASFMRNRRLTLAFPPYSISPQSSQRAGANSRKELEVDLEDWLSFDRFPPLSSKQKSPKVAFGLPKHLQLSDLDRVEGLRHGKLPLVAAVDSNSIAIGNLPIHFS